MMVHFVPAYWSGIIGLVAGGGVGLLLAARSRATSRLSTWDARVTVPLLLAAGSAHLFLIPAVESQRQVLFGLYCAALIGTAAFAMSGVSVWRLGAIVFPLGSIGAYFYFALQVHQADYIGLLVKMVELAAVVAALTPVAASGRVFRVRSTAA